MILKINDIVFSYDSRDTLNGITFEAGSGHLIGIVGPNGCGKTTLLKCVNNALAPRSGVITLDAQPTRHLSRKKLAREMGMVPQFANNYLPFTVLDIVLMGREPHLKGLGGETEKDLEIARDAMAWTGVLHLADRLATELSGGEMQRVIIARAFAQEPRVMLLDEPTSSLDIKYQLEIMEVVRKMTKEKSLATVLVSHDLNMMARYCDELLVLNRGRIAAAGKPAKILTPDILREVYHIETEIHRDARTGSMYIDYLAPLRTDSNEIPEADEASNNAVKESL